MMYVAREAELVSICAKQRVVRVCVNSAPLPYRSHLDLVHAVSFNMELCLQVGPGG